MRKTTLIGTLAAIAAAMATVPTALAGGTKGGDPGVIKRGKCSASSTWKLKAKQDDARIETEFEVDQNVVGRRWRVTILRNGSVAFTGVRRTLAPSGSFEVRRLLASSAGSDRIVARARALSGGERCRAALTL